uniref:Uncharacterized protein n=1 Tax=Rhizophora mucronata TaxID=61149 RepID=A0A2P2PMB2_RHIMU
MHNQIFKPNDIRINT